MLPGSLGNGHCPKLVAKHRFPTGITGPPHERPVGLCGRRAERPAAGGIRGGEDVEDLVGATTDKMEALQGGCWPCAEAILLPILRGSVIPLSDKAEFLPLL